MSWCFEQLTGAMRENSILEGVGYSGQGDGKNNPKMQSQQGIGPIPQGWYTILSPHDTDTHGPYVLTLIPDDTTELYGRSGFLIHGDSIGNPGNASHGCICISRAVRQQIWASGDHRLQVIEG